MHKLLLIWLHIAQFVLLPLMTLGQVFGAHSLPLAGDSPLWWVVLLGVVAGLFSSLLYGFKVGQFDAKHLELSRSFVIMVLVPLGWLGWAALEGADSYADAARETGMVVLIGHHLVLSTLLLLDVLRALRTQAFEVAAIFVVGWRVLATALLGTVCVALCWAWSLGHSRAEILGLGVTVLAELAASVPFYRANFAKIFED
jgi:hypothetical protein